MTLKEAKKILGKEIIKCSDDEILEDIEMASLFKDLFFRKFTETSNNLNCTSPMCHN